MNISQTLFDAHLHFGDTERMGELERYCRRTGLKGAVLLSLPYPGWINFNPEVLYAKAHRPDYFWAFASFDLFSEDRSPGSIRMEMSHAGWLPTSDLGRQTVQFSEMGFDGLKIWSGKPSFQQVSGLTPDGPELSDAFDAAGESGMPVVLHMADPVEFWPRNGTDSGSRADKGVVYGRAGADKAGLSIPFEEYIAQAERSVAAHPQTTFIFPHLLFLAQDLPRLSAFLDAFPNACLDVSPGKYYFAPLSRHPEAAKEFFSSYSGRILFGTDLLFYPKSFTALDQVDEGRLFEQFSLVYRFFFGEGSSKNPFSRTAEEVPEVKGPEFGRSARKSLAWRAFYRIFSGTGEGGSEEKEPQAIKTPPEPKTLQPENVVPYLETFPRRLSFLEEIKDVLEWK